MPLEDFGQFRLVHPDRLQSVEDAVEELRSHATAEMYRDEDETVWANFGASLNSLYRLQEMLRALHSEIHAGYEAHRE